MDTAEQNQRQRGMGYPENVGLYAPEFERDACGVGMVVRLDRTAEHRVVELGLTALKRLIHRGAVGEDPNTGDGAGILLSMPDAFFRKVLPFDLPEAGRYAVAVLFGGLGNEEKIEQIAAREGASVLGWRTVPTRPNEIGEAARIPCPAIRQLFLGVSPWESVEAFERKLFVIRRLWEKSVPNLYAVSLSAKRVVYKGLLLATQIDSFYPDLRDETFASPLCLVHQRYSTNTFPAWPLAQPFRFLAHNGEINTLRGNLNQLRSRESSLASDLFGDDLAKVLPLIDSARSDSACLDNMLELLVMAGRSLPHAMLMLLPQAWGKKYHLGRDIRGFLDYHSAQMEPWDGPAAVLFSDGEGAGAMLDRNGLRPARWTLTDDGLFSLASEAGVLDFDPARVVRRGRLRPGEMIWCDPVGRRLVFDAEMKNAMARKRPYRRWAEENKITVDGLFDSVAPSAVGPRLTERQRFFGWTREDVETILLPMAENGREPTGSMGNDAQPAILSEKPRPLFDYFKQLFAQVTNPPIDPIREELVMSLTTYIGNRGNFLADDAQRAELVKLTRPILTEEDLRRLEQVRSESFGAATLRIFWTDSLEKGLERLENEAVENVRFGRNLLVLSDRDPETGEIPIPSLLAVAAVHRRLIAEGLRPSAGIILHSGEIREVEHFALALGYGATALCPYLALETVAELAQSGRVALTERVATENYIRAIDKGLLKIMSKMGISTLRSYRGGAIFEAIGLAETFVERYFPGTASRIGGLSLEGIERESRQRFEQAQKTELPILDVGGEYRWRRDGATHRWTPDSLRLFREAVWENDPEKFRRYSQLADDPTEACCTLRSLFAFTPSEPVPLDEVEPVQAILRRFVAGAMSLGALSPEAHEAIALAMNQIGAMSNCGEGGEDAERSKPTADGRNRKSAIRQVASGRFGVTADYLANACEIQIKMAQGAKPGEGGQLPGHKVNDFVAKVRHSIPGVTLISPPPHHDIYSIEDLAQLIFDLKNVNPQAPVSVKLVSEAGVGTIAAGVAKAHADTILISGQDGGTGAAPLSSVKYAGAPWELGLAETQQTLVLNRLRGRVRLQTDGQLRTARDVVIAALLGAEQFGFATSILVALGCVMMRRCHENCCPVGVATQDEELRKRFRGKSEYIVNFLTLLASNVREQLAALGFRSLDEALGRSDRLTRNRAVGCWKTRDLDFSRIFKRVASGSVPDRFTQRQPVPARYDDQVLIPHFKETLATGQAARCEAAIHSKDRSVGAGLSSEVVRRFGPNKLADGTLRVDFTGVAGQSFGAFLAKGITFTLEGEANDGVGKGISGGEIVVRPPRSTTFKPHENVIAGNVVGYGGTAGKMFFLGQAGERFAVRNSGFDAVVEGIGDHGCEYMTGGRVVVLGETGVNFAAGMTGGVAYVCDESNDFDLRCNVDSVDLETVEPGSDDERELLDLIRQHRERTGSQRAAELLDHWPDERGRFVKVIPFEYKNVLAQKKSHEE